VPVGQLQFEVVAQRLQSGIQGRRGLRRLQRRDRALAHLSDENIRREFERQQYSSLATDVDGNPVFLAANKYNLQVTMERWPKVGFHATREHGERLAQG